MGLKKHSPGCNCCNGCYLIQRAGGTDADDWDLADDFTVTGTYAQSFSYLHPVSGMSAITDATDNDPDRFFFSVTAAQAGDRYEIFVGYADANNYLRIEIEYEAAGSGYKGFNTVKFYQAASGVESQVGGTHHWLHYSGKVTFEGCYTDEGYDGNGEVRCSIYPDAYDLLWTAGRNTVYSFSEQVTTSGTRAGFGTPVIADSRTLDVYAIGWAYHNDERSRCPDCGVGCETNDWEVNWLRRQHYDLTTFNHIFQDIDSGTNSGESDALGNFIGVSLDSTLDKYIAYSESADCQYHNIKATLKIRDTSDAPQNSEVCLITDYFDEDNYHYGLVEFATSGTGTIMLSLVKVEGGSSSVIDSNSMTGVGLPDEISVELCHASTTELRISTEVNELIASTTFHGGKKIGVMKTLAARCVLRDVIGYKTLYGDYTQDQFLCHQCQNHECSNCNSELLQVELLDFPWGAHNCSKCDDMRGTFILQSKKAFSGDPWEKVKCYWQGVFTVNSETLTVTAQVEPDPWLWHSHMSVTIKAHLTNTLGTGGCGAAISARGSTASFAADRNDCAFKDKRFGLSETNGARTCGWMLQGKVSTV